MAQFLQFLQVAAAETAPLAKNCAILFDEMSVDTRLCYDQQRDVIVGPHKQAQVIMVRSICGAWKQPVYVAFDTAISPEILMQLILSLEEMGYPVRAVVSDMGSKNVGLWRALGVSYDGETSIANPAAADRRVWFFADVPHCLKNLRNHILDDGLYLGCGGDRGDPVVDSDLMEELAREVSATEFTVNRKLTALHVHAAKGDRQRVYLAAQLLSETVAKSIPEVFEGQEKAAEVINIIDSGFDVLNSRRRYADKPLRCGLGVHLTEQLAALRKLEELLLTARFGSRKTLLPFQQGFLLSIRSTLALYKEMEKVDGFQFLQTALLNQDALESLFSSVRTKFGSNLNPTPTELLYRLRLLLIGASPAAARQTSVRPASLPEEGLLSAARAGRPPQCGTEDEFVVPIFSGYDATTISSTTIAPSVDQLSAATPPEPAVPVELLEEIGVPPNGAETETSQAISEYGMQYAAGFVAAKRAKVDPTLGTRTCDMAEEDVPSGARWIYLLSRGHLTVPSEQWLENFKEFEVVFCAIHRGQGMARRNGTLDQLSRAPGVVKTLSDTLCLRWPRLDERVISLYARLRTFIRLRHVAKVRRGDHLAALAEAAARRSEKPTPTPVVGTRRQFVKARQFARGAVYL
ncbi:Transposable element P transposase [Amphibalanus amphitrite]|nr:Transposable element P transposase [Amphibalanus amphitrite]